MKTPMVLEERRNTLKRVLKEVKEIKRFNEVAEQKKYPDWLRGFNIAIDSIISYIESELKKC